MAYDEKLADRVRALVQGTRHIGELKMFGGLCFTLQGNMAVGINGDELMARVGPDAYEASLQKPGARAMDFTGRPLTGYLFVGPAGIKTKPQLQKWVADCLAFTGSLPPKRKKPKQPPKKKAAKKKAAIGARKKKRG